MMYDIKLLTLEEKLRLLCGKDYWKVSDANGKLPKTSMSDGPSGLRKVVDGKELPATSMPALSVVSNTWSKECAKLDGKTIADECIENDVEIILAPGVNIKRTPLNGRNFEYFSEDPYQAGILSKEFIKGAQEKGVGTSLKHFSLNNREWDRLNTSSEVDERALMEIYLPAFEKALEAKPYTIMGSYNKVNGVLACENRWLLNDILRNKLGFDGVIVSDWGAVRNHYLAAKATVDVVMPYSSASYPELKEAYDQGLLTEEEIDQSVIRILELIEKCHSANKKVEYTKEQRHQNAVKIAEEGIVLLKNQGALPLKSGKILVSHHKTPIIGGGGSAYVNTSFEQPDLGELLSNKLGDKVQLDVYTRWPYSATQLFNSRDVSELRRRAFKNDTVIYTVFGPLERENEDRDDIKLPKTVEDAILMLAKQNKNVVVLVIGGSAIDMSAWIDQVNAVLYCGYAGEGLTEAVANILSGEVCPSGKLSETFPLCLEDTFTKSSHGNGDVEWYNDGIFVGYRFYDFYEKDVLFPFGYGLSYADFTYSNLNIIKNSETNYTISYDITNNSDFDAKEVSQVYVKDYFSAVIRPEKELKGFSKDLIKAHQTKTIKIELDERAFAYYSAPKKAWHVENGDFEIIVGASSRDIRLSKKIQINLPKLTQFTI